VSSHSRNRSANAVPPALRPGDRVKVQRTECNRGMFVGLVFPFLRTPATPAVRRIATVECALWMTLSADCPLGPLSSRGPTVSRRVRMGTTRAAGEPDRGLDPQRPWRCRAERCCVGLAAERHRGEFADAAAAEPE